MAHVILHVQTRAVPIAYPWSHKYHSQGSSLSYRAAYYVQVPGSGTNYLSSDCSLGSPATQQSPSHMMSMNLYHRQPVQFMSSLPL